jgi:hypothetical protein
VSRATDEILGVAMALAGEGDSAHALRLAGAAYAEQEAIAIGERCLVEDDAGSEFPSFLAEGATRLLSHRGSPFDRGSTESCNLPLDASLR